jgi:glucosylceramidase
LAIKLLFDPAEGIGLDWGRIPMGPSDYAIERYTLSSAPGEFDISHDEMYLIPYIQEAQKIKCDVKYWASPWTPPPWAKTDTGCNSSDPGQPACMKNGGYDKGRFDEMHYEAYAQYFVDWVTAYEAAGIPIHSVTPQNEPGWSQGYPTASFGPATDSQAQEGKEVFLSETVTFGPFVQDYLYPAMQALPTTPGIWFGTMSNNTYFDNYWNSLTDKSKVIGVALQWATIAQLDGSEPWPDNYLVMQSEHECGNDPWRDAAASKEAADKNTFWAAEAPNNYNYGLKSWELLRDWIRRGVNVYSQWNMVLDTGGFNLDEDRPWPQNAALVVDKGTGALTITPYYYVFRHLAQYSDPDGSLLNTTGDVLAFKNGDGSVMVTVFNPGGSPSMETLSVDGNMVQFSVPAGGWATVNM